MKAKILVSISGLIVSMLTPLAVLVPQVSAAVVTWDGGGADNNWATAANWSGDTAPVDGDSVVFDLSTFDTNVTLENNIVDLNLVGISVIGTGTGNVYEVTGNELFLSGGFFGADTSSSIEFNLTVTLTNDVVITQDASGVKFTGENSIFNIGSHNLSLSDDAFVFLKNLEGSGNVDVTAGFLSLSPSNNLPSYSGTITASAGTVSMSANSLLATASVVISGSGRLLVATAATNVVAAALSLGGNGTGVSLNTMVNANSNPIQLSGGLTLTSNIEVQLEVDLQITGDFNDNGFEFELAPFSEGEVILPGGEVVSDTEETITIDIDDKSSAILIIGNKKTYIVNGERGNTTVSAGGILKGTGKVGILNVQLGGILAPGLSPGCIASGDLTIMGTYEVEIAGTTACSEYDQTPVTGTVSLSGATLVLSFLNSFVPALNDEFIIINNDGTDAVTGTFEGLAEGTRFDVAGVTFEISYEGGDGKDVVLTAVSVPTTATAPDTGIGSLLASPISALFAVVLSLGAVTGIRKIQTR